MKFATFLPDCLRRKGIASFYFSIFTVCSVYLVFCIFDGPVFKYSQVAYIPVSGSGVNNIDGNDLPMRKYSKPMPNTSLDACLDDIKFDFDGKFLRECGWWIKTIEMWKAGVGRDPEENFLNAYQLRSGTGDRLAGLMGAFFFAMQRREKLRVHWPLLDEVFTETCLVQDILSINKIKAKSISSTSCLQKSYYSCSYQQHIQDNCAVFNRACMTKSACQRLVKNLRPKRLSMKNVVGCPLRAMLQFSSSFLNHEISWYLNFKNTTGTIKELISELEQFHIIAVHLRLGDNFLGKDHGLGKRSGLTEHLILNHTEDCLNIVKDVFNQSKKVKYLIASDSQDVKRFYRKFYPSEVVVVNARARHLSSIRRHASDEDDKSIKDLFAEWLLISRADELITNRAHRFGISAFSRSAWLYSLRSTYFEVSRKSGSDYEVCYRKEFEYRGNTGLIPADCY